MPTAPNRVETVRFLQDVDWSSFVIIFPPFINSQSSPSVTNCHDTCEFLKMTIDTKKGDCPPLEDITGFGLACAETCSSDNQCGHKLKCCYNGCGRTCQEPIINKKCKCTSFSCPSIIPPPSTIPHSKGLSFGLCRDVLVRQPVWPQVEMLLQWMR